MSKRMIVAGIALVGVFVALYLTMYKYGVIGELSCSIGSCETVNTSRWSIFLGLPVAAWGLGFYVAALVAALVGVQPRWMAAPAVSWLLVGMSGIGVLFSAWLTWLEANVIHAYCMYCLISAGLVTLIFFTALLDLRDVARGAPLGAAAPDAPDTPAQRTAIG